LHAAVSEARTLDLGHAPELTMPGERRDRPPGAGEWRISVGCQADRAILHAAIKEARTRQIPAALEGDDPSFVEREIGTLKNVLEITKEKV
jgi:hypothetical protein